MFLFKNHKKISHKQAAIIGFVLAVMSVLTSGIVMYLLPVLMNWVHLQGIFGLDGLFLGFGVTVFLAIQGLLLFGFPLYYAQDKKSHMTGFQILIYALLWEVVIMAVAILIAMAAQGPVPAQPNYGQFPNGEVQLPTQTAPPAEAPAQ